MSVTKRTAASGGSVAAGLAVALLILCSGGTALAQSQPATAPPAASTTKLEVPDDKGGQLIKIIQKKDFLKRGRLELTAFLGGETIDYFIHHWVAGASATYHLTEVFAIEGVLGYSPYLGEFDLKQLTQDIYYAAAVQPRSSKMGLYGHTGLVFSPLYGKMAFLSNKIVNFDIYFMSGFGAVSTQDLNSDEDSAAVEIDTTRQIHFATNLGFGFRGAFNDWVAFKLEGREYFYIESVTVEDAEPPEFLNVKYYFMAQAGLSFFFPTTRR